MFTPILLAIAFFGGAYTGQTVERANTCIKEKAIIKAMCDVASSTECELLTEIKSTDKCERLQE
jgi:hypothetical protein